jgi:hypothetical protein
MTTYPMLERLRAIEDKSHAIGDFLEWLEGKGVFLASYYEEAGLSRYRVNIQELLAEFFDIDLDELEKETHARIKELGTIKE